MSKNCKPPVVVYLVKLFLLHHVECRTYKALGALEVFLFLLTGECKRCGVPRQSLPQVSCAPVALCRRTARARAELLQLLPPEHVLGRLSQKSFASLSCFWSDVNSLPL